MVSRAGGYYGIAFGGGGGGDNWKRFVDLVQTVFWEGELAEEAT